MAIEKKKVQNSGLLDEFKPAPLPRLYSKSQLESFGKRLGDFYEEKQLPILGDRTKTESVMVLNIWEAMVAFGAARKNKPVTFNGVTNESYSIVMKDTGGDRHGNKSYEIPSKYDIFMDKYDQWLKLNGAKSFGETARLADYEKMASEVAGDMRYTPNVPEYD